MALRMTRIRQFEIQNIKNILRYLMFASPGSAAGTGESDSSPYFLGLNSESDSARENLILL